MSVLSNLIVALNLDDKGFKKGASSAQKSASELGKAFKGAAIIGAGVVMAKVAEEGVSVVKDQVGEAIKAAEDMQQVQLKTNAIFGAGSTAIGEWGEGAATSLGMSKEAALTSADSFGNLFKNVGFTTAALPKMSENMTGVVANLAAFNNADPSAVMAAIQSGLAGNMRGLKQYGIVISNSDIATEALRETGKKRAKDLTTEELVQARYNLIMGKTAGIMGTVKARSGTLAGESKTLRAEIANLRDEFGAKLLPVLTKVVGWFVTALGTFALLRSRGVNPATAALIAFRQLIEKVIGHDLAMSIERGIKKFATIVVTAIDFVRKHFQQIKPYIKDVVKAFALLQGLGIVITIIEGIGAALAVLLSPIALVIGAVILFYLAYTHNWLGIRDITNRVVAWLIPKFRALVKELPAIVAKIRQIGAAFVRIGVEIGQFAAKMGVFKHFEGAAKNFYKMFLGIVKLFGDLIHGRWNKIWGDLVTIVDAYLHMIFDLWSTMPETLWNVIMSIDWAGIGSSILNGIGGAFAGAGQLLVSAGNLIIAGLSSGITIGWNWMIGWLVKMPGWIIGVFDNAATFLYGAGVDLLRGLENGIAAGWDSFKSWLSGLWDALPGWAKKAWEIASPSKVFERMGVANMAGLQIGHEKMIPALKKTMLKVTSAVAGASFGSPGSLTMTPMAGVAGAGGAGAKGGDSYTFHIHESQSAEATARAIVLEIKRRKAGK